ncbi:MAG TPA: serine O-acetyltransferase [Candidatus Sulfotelmatobacter sp.]|nr:serine O-acetyltransferase [Candidatus Sulfotelmatobacter sp.]
MTTPNHDLVSLAKEFRCALEARLSGIADDQYRLAAKDGVNEFCRRYLEALFPLYYAPEAHLDPLLAHFVEDLEARLGEQIVRAMRFDYTCSGKKPADDLKCSADQIVRTIQDRLPRLAQLLATDLQAALKNDPAASGLEEILLSYPGVEAITVQRLAHELYKLDVPYLPRIMTELAHSKTGIDIHPGATIDDSFFIDHGTGVVIGETATIGKQVTMYHGVTLGAFNPTARRDTGGELVRGLANKRHPDIEDHVTIYAGATIIGGDTRIGHHSIIGGNVWLTHSVAPYSRVAMREPELVIRTNAKDSDWEWFLGSSI